MMVFYNNFLIDNLIYNCTIVSKDLYGIISIFFISKKILTVIVYVFVLYLIKFIKLIVKL